MPLDVLGRTRATLTRATSITWSGRTSGNLYSTCRAGDRSLQLWILNEEFLVSISHQLVLITSLPFVHTARRSYRLSGSVNFLDCAGFSLCGKLIKPYHLEEGKVVTRFP
jgi:hypothetical protein